LFALELSARHAGTKHENGVERMIDPYEYAGTFEQGIRFLADYLAGDTYYKVHRDGHNIDRCRAQFKLLESIEQQEERMDWLVRSLEP
jgi:hypothetical protein